MSLESPKRVSPLSVPAINPEFVGALDELVERRVIRVLVVSSPMFYFLDGARQRGVPSDGVKEFD